MSVVPEDASPSRLVDARRWSLNGATARRLRADRIARWTVSAGGLLIIASILGILVFILMEVWPLLSGATVRVARIVSLPSASLLTLLADEHRTFVAGLDTAGSLTVLRVEDGEIVLRQPLIPPADPAARSEHPSAGSAEAGATPLTLLDLSSQPTRGIVSASTSDGRVAIGRVRWPVTFDAQDRVTTPGIDPPVVVPLDPSGGPVAVHAVHLGEEGATVAGQLESGALAVLRRSSRENLLTGEITESIVRGEIPLAFRLSCLTMAPDGRRLYGGTADGRLFAWPLSGATLGPPEEARTAGGGITALALLIGGQALVVGEADGALSVWFRVPREDGSYALQRIRDFPPHAAAIRWISSSQRDKGFLAMDARGGMGLYYSTSGRTLWTGEAPVRAPGALAFSPKADAAFVTGEGGLAELSIRNPHPQVSLRALFGRVWYEGYGSPEFVWQSSSASDAFEPKLSLTPLLVGTLKGTLYSLILAIPLAVFGAMYASQFMHPALKNYVKPTIEIMAALPSVVLGFLAGLWLAPRLEQVLPSLLLMLLILPALVLLTGWAVRSLRSRIAARLPVGMEVLPFTVSLAVGIWFCIELSPFLESLAFGGNFPEWLTATTGLAYDQRNAVVVGMAMGFAVIPIIFSISEDAFSNVPQNLVSGSLALGASRWQTVTRVVFPTASPGIFSAVMIGFGRAVGETMIVLMATGNTPIMDWNPFNGFRTLSANIAVEIPEAPRGDTLYRTLFLAALLLFILTFVVNTAAELVRQRLRRRYAQL
ncbi:MAG: ABC transporter permease subunit [Deltaproteobacteria bacterium]|nr:ABC transporter permease subunit [Deltaproteobacteria bacterium]